MTGCQCLWLLEAASELCSNFCHCLSGCKLPLYPLWTPQLHPRCERIFSRLADDLWEVPHKVSLYVSAFDTLNGIFFSKSPVHIYD